MKARVAVLAFVAGTACGRLTDPPLPPDAQRFLPPPVYTRWWSMMESCSGLRGSLNQIDWYSTSGPLENPENVEEYIEGYWSRASNRIVLISNDTVDGGTVRHEMLHALVRTGGHPRSKFLQKCGGLVECGIACVNEGGPAPSVVPGTLVIAPSDLEVTSEVSPLPTRASVDNGLAMLTILVRNPFPRSVVVAMPGRASDPSVITSYRAEFRKSDGTGVVQAELVIDPGVMQFAAGETKRQVIDFAIAAVPAPGRNILHGLGTSGIALPMGSYSFRAAFGGKAAPDLPIALIP